ncbi:hypothetical protein FKM82_023096, partial [Ascaphus truei]
MSKKQRDILLAEVQQHRLKEQRTEAPISPCSADPQSLQSPLASSPGLPQAFSHTSAAWSGHSRWESCCSLRPCTLPRAPLQRDPLILQPHTSENPQMEKTCFRDLQPHVEPARPSVFQRLPPCQNPDSYINLSSGSCPAPECMMSVGELDLLMQNIVFAHRETCQFRQENLQVLRWETFSQIEVQSFQQKPMVQMWERCVCHVTDAIQYIVEFAKRLSGFMELSANDQIVLLKAGKLMPIVSLSFPLSCSAGTV